MSAATTILLTGATGFLGSRLARRFVADGYRVAVITRQPYFQNKTYRVAGDLKRTDTIMNNTLWIGVYPGLSERMLDYAAEKI